MRVRGWMVVAACVGWATVSQAQAPQLRLVWEAPPTCMDAETLRGALQEVLGHDPFVATEQDPARATLVAELRAADTGFHARIDLAGRVRAIDSPHPECARFDEALVVVIALLVDEVREEVAALPLQAEPPPQVDARPPTRLRVPPRPPRPFPQEITEPPSARWAPLVRATGLFVLGYLPGATGGGEIALGLRRAGRGWVLRAGAQLWAPRGSRDGIGRGLRFSATHGTLGFGWLARPHPRVGLGAETVVAIGALFVQSLGLTEAAERTYLDLRADLRARASARLGMGLWIELSVGGSADVLRRRHVIQVRGGRTLPVHRAWPVALHLGLGLRWILGNE